MARDKVVRDVLIEQMAADATEDKGLFRLNVGLEDAVRFEDLLTKENIEFQSYLETIQDIVKVFVFNRSDSSKVNVIVAENEITTSHIDQVMISSNSVKADKLYLTTVLIAVALTLIALALVR